MSSILTLRVAARYQFANRPSGERKKTREKVRSVNRPKGITRDVVKDHAKTRKEGPDVEKPHRYDLQPKDVFAPRTDNMSMINYVRRGWPGDADDYSDMEKVLNKQVPKDQGFDTVKNLSQYLIETEGGGGTPPVRQDD